MAKVKTDIPKEAIDEILDKEIKRLKRENNSLKSKIRDLEIQLNTNKSRFDKATKLLQYINEFGDLDSYDNYED
jgi:uncharacterized protein YeeX (DUF496 family)